MSSLNTHTHGHHHHHFLSHFSNIASLQLTQASVFPSSFFFFYPSYVSSLIFHPQESKNFKISFSLPIPNLNTHARLLELFRICVPNSKKHPWISTQYYRVLSILLLKIPNCLPIRFASLFFFSPT